MSGNVSYGKEKRIISILSILFLLILATSCNSGTGTDTNAQENEQEDPGTRDVFRLSGIEEGKPIKVFLEFKDMIPSQNEDSPPIRSMEGFLVFDGLTISMKGTIVETSGSFTVSANGTYGNARLVASLYGYILSDKVVYSNLNLNVMRDGSPEFTHQIFLDPTEEDIVETTIYYQDDTTQLPFDGWWYELGLETKEVLLNLNSSTYFYTANGSSGSHTNNGAVLFVEADLTQSTVTEKVWSFVYASDINQIGNFDEDSTHIAYPIIYGKLAYTDDSSVLYMAFPEDDEYYITKYNLYQIFLGNETAYSNEVIEYVEYTGESPRGTQIKTMDDMKTLARNFSIPEDKESTEDLDVYPFSRL